MQNTHFLKKNVTWVFRRIKCLQKTSESRSLEALREKERTHGSAKHDRTPVGSEAPLRGGDPHLPSGDSMRWEPGAGAAAMGVLV